MLFGISAGHFHRCTYGHVGHSHAMTRLRFLNSQRTSSFSTGIAAAAARPRSWFQFREPHHFCRWAKLVERQWVKEERQPTREISSWWIALIMTALVDCTGSLFTEQWNSYRLSRPLLKSFLLCLSIASHLFVSSLCIVGLPFRDSLVGGIPSRSSPSLSPRAVADKYWKADSIYLLLLLFCRPTFPCCSTRSGQQRSRWRGQAGGQRREAHNWRGVFLLYKSDWRWDAIGCGGRMKTK